MGILLSAIKFENHPDSRNLCKAKPSALNSQSESLYTQQFLWMVNVHHKNENMNYGPSFKYYIQYL